jgi:hypothetical protein
VRMAYGVFCVVCRFFFLMVVFRLIDLVIHWIANSDPNLS